MDVSCQAAFLDSSPQSSDLGTQEPLICGLTSLKTLESFPLNKQMVKNYTWDNYTCHIAVPNCKGGWGM